MAKRVPKIQSVNQTRFNTTSPIAIDFTIPGYEFRWVNPDARTAMQTWRHWRAVEKDSEFGQQVLEQMQKAPDKYGPSEGSSNYFRRGSQLLLAYAKKEDCDAYRKAMTDKADERLRAVGGNLGKQREIYISSKDR